MGSLTAWYQATRAQRAEQQLEPHFKNAQLAQLHVRYVELMDELVKEMDP